MTVSAVELEIPDAAERARALDPGRSFIVQAPAGSGKTTLLAQRYVHLLTRVQRPEEILAITFTIKAAAEMRHRVLTLLAADTAAARIVRERSETGGWHIFSNPNVLKIQTIDSFALELASQIPFLRNAAGLGIAEDATPFYEEAATRLFNKLFHDNPSNPLLAEFLAFLDNDADRAVRLLSHMLGRRDQWLATVTAVATNDDQTLIARLLFEAVSAVRRDIQAGLDASFTAEDADTLAAFAEALGVANDWHELFPVLLTKSGKLRRRLTVRQGIHDAEQKRTFNRWLESLHKRDLESLIVSFTRAPPPEMPRSPSSAQQLHTLHLCCVCLALAAAELDELLSAAGVLDFTGLLLRAGMALRDDRGPTDLALSLDYRIRHVLVDEYQDTSRAQFEFFNLLTEGWYAGGDTTFFAVGDPMQSVYRFRDADVSIFADSQNRGLANVPLTSCALRANFRSDPLLVEWCNALFETLFGASHAARLGEVRFSPAVPMVPDAAKAAVACLRFADSRDETHAVVQHVQALLADDHTANIAVLCRARGHLTELLEAFSNVGLPVQATDMNLLTGRLVIRDLMSLHSVLLRPHDRLGWFGLLRSPLFGLTLAELTSFADVTDFDTAISEDPETVGRQLQRLRQALSWARARLYEIPLREVIEGMWLQCGGTDAYEESEWRHARAWFDLLEELRSEAYERAPLERALQSLYAATEPDARVQIMTIHKAKGLEFDHVVVPYLHRRAQSDDAQLLLWRAGAEGLLMGVRGDPVHDWLLYEERERAVNEEKRLLYVACTRAKQTLFTSFSCNAQRQPGGLAKWLAHVASDRPHHGDPGPHAEHVVNQGDLFRTQHLQRLAADYAWRPPAYRGLTSKATERSAVEADHISSRFEVAVGLLTHRALAWWASDRAHHLQPLSAERLSMHLQRWARELALDVTEHPTLCDVCTDQILRTWADARGRWLLSAHDEARSEWPLTGMYGGALTSIVLDRTFVDAGTRWIIDFKTSQPQPAEALQDFLAREVARYTPQLHKYAMIGAAVYAQPITTALYFTAVSHLQVINQTGA